MPYGSAAGVASRARTWTRSGTFIDPDVYQNGTPTTLTEVTDWLAEISQTVNVAFENEGFVTPVTLATVLESINGKVNAAVADLVHLAHNKGRLFSDRIQQSGKSGEDIVKSELVRWVQDNANGFEAMGVPRRVQKGSQQAYSVPMTRQK